jgi:hypothetical protein
MNKDDILRLLQHPVLYSLTLHILIIIIFALWHIRSESMKNWHSFEWFNKASFEQTKLDQSHVLSHQAGEGLLAADELSEQVSGGEETSPSRIIEMPKLSQDSSDESEIDFSMGDLRLGVDGQNSGVQGERTLQLQGKSDAFFIRETLPNITPLMDDNVVVEFKIGRDGKVLMSSINVVSYRKAEHVQSLRKAMEEWKFGFTGKYKPDQSYRIRCKFTLR